MNKQVPGNRADLPGKQSTEACRMDPVPLNPAWIAFIRHCRELGFGEISVLKIQDGVPVLAEESRRKIKFV